MGQIPLMGKIYAQAERVVVWLGEPEDGFRVAMKGIAANTLTSAYNAVRTLVADKYGHVRTYEEYNAAVEAGEIHGQAMQGRNIEIGEIARLLDRPWWKRVWIVQEVALAQKAVVMCGGDAVPWEKIKKVLESGWTTGMQRYADHHLQLRNGMVFATRTTFPDAELQLLEMTRNASALGTLDSHLYNLLYRFRRLNCTLPHDRLFGFMGLMSQERQAGITVDYGIPVHQLYLQTARTLITAHGHLLLLNCKRQTHGTGVPDHHNQIFSVSDRTRFADTGASVLDSPDAKPRNGWARLPHGWERRVQDNGTVKHGNHFEYYDHMSNQTSEDSPLMGHYPLPVNKAIDLDTIPQDWSKVWDNLGKVSFVWNAQYAISTADVYPELAKLPSWVPNWQAWGSRDPEPLPRLEVPDLCYWASGKEQRVQFSTENDGETDILAVKGIHFDVIQRLAPSWCPEGPDLPFTIRGVTILEDWEKLALKGVETCPYANLAGGREAAFWRTHIADYAGAGAVAAEDRVFFDLWREFLPWSEPYTSFVEGGKSRVNEAQAFVGMFLLNIKQFTDSEFPVDEFHVLRYTLKSFTNRLEILLESVKRPLWEFITATMHKYKDFRARIYRASRNRAMFVTKKGYLGLAPWNAREGDVVAILLGGCTPFLLRRIRGSRYSLVGEAYVHGIMAGELFEQGNAVPEVKDFLIL